ncbi:DUF3577 domain-containing protein [Alcaligenes sp. MMA]|uniref:DUF3577 domain-containing protein n=1 Tax=unclassified Alcaligenes TaxID=259357 RepID=UPI001E2EE7DC|nr:MULTISPECIES: DUF3577 domain-containing protein [unclassified Alcaligenes]MCC9162561.1 DUF3577 domain-containing protein [Alcaligenes sp. MMA]UYY85595.1 DUF3577 domain-containing protein [Alcaligenes sp. SMD-FA]
MTTASTQTSNHFNLHVNGVGYLNRIRWVETKGSGRKAKPFLSCSISAMRGNADEPDYTYFDLRVSGSEAIEMVEKLMGDVEAKRKVFVSFRVGDIYAHSYMRNLRDEKGRATGEQEPAALIKGRLLLINSVTVDGVNIFRRASQEERSMDDVPFQDDTPLQGFSTDDEFSPAVPEQERFENKAPQENAQDKVAPKFNSTPVPVNQGAAAYQAGYGASSALQYAASYAHQSVA